MTLPEDTPTPEDTPKPEEPSGLEETPNLDDIFSAPPVLPEGFTPIGDMSHMTRARRRQAQRKLVPPGENERAALLEDLARRAFPSVEFFLFAILCGVLLGAAYLFDQPALLLLAVLVAPLLTPWVGLTLAVVTGSWRFFVQTLTSLLVGGLLVFLTGALAGAIGRFWKTDLHFFYANVHARLWWADLLLVALGAIFLAISFIRSEQRPVVASIMLAYGLFLPLGAAGLGLGISNSALVSGGLSVFLVHLSLSVFLGGITLLFLRFKPLKASNYLLPFFIGLASLLVLVLFTGLVTFLREGITAASHRLPTTTPSPTVTSALLRTSTPTASLMPSITPSITLTPELLPYDAVISSLQGDGAYIRTEPGSGAVITTVLNGIVVQVLNETQMVGSVPWEHVRMADGVEGWVLQSVLTVTPGTPSPGLSLTATPTP